MSQSMEPAIEGTTWGNPGIAIDWLFRSPAFGITRWDCRGSGQRSLSSERVQAWHVVSFVHSGAFVQHCGGRAELIDPTAVLLYNPQAPHRTSHPYGCCDHGSAIVVRRDALLDAMRHCDPSSEERFDALFTASHLRGLSRLWLRQRLLVQALERSAPRDPLAFETAVLGLLGEIVEEHARRRGVSPPAGSAGSSRARRDYVEDAKALLQERFREKLHLEDIARALYVSTFHLCRLFKEETGVPIHHYLTRLRLREAVEPVLSGAADLGRQALELGFSSHSHFTAAFRQEFGMSPREVRRMGKAITVGSEPATPRGCPASAGARPPGRPPAPSAEGSPRRPPASPAGTRG
jgi:AraC family transcriptional regulator